MTAWSQMVSIMWSCSINWFYGWITLVLQINNWNTGTKSNLFPINLSTTGCVSCIWRSLWIGTCHVAFFDIFGLSIINRLQTIVPQNWDNALLCVLILRLVYDRETGKPKGYGFCEYQDQETALSAMRNLNGREFSGRALRVDNAASEKNKEELKSKHLCALDVDSLSYCVGFS